MLSQDNTQGARIANPFEDFEPSKNQNGPVRIIEVNDRVRQLDDLHHGSGVVSAYSAVKATLSVNNLKLIKCPSLPGRRLETRQFVSPSAKKRPRHSGRSCEGEGCTKELSPEAKGKLCIKCFRKNQTAERLVRNIVRKAAGKPIRCGDAKLLRVKCDRCPRLLRAGRASGRCFRCGEKQRHKRLR